MRILKTLLVLFLLTFPVHAQDSGQTQPTGTIEVKDSAKQDAAIAVRIRDIMGELEGYTDVTVTVSSGIVSLKGTALNNDAIGRLGELVSRVDGVVAIENTVAETTEIAERINPAIDRLWQRTKQIIAYLPLAIIAAAVFVLIVFAGFFFARRKSPWDKIAPNCFIADIYRQIVRVASVIAGLVVALDILGATALLSTILGAAGIIGLAIGFAVRDTVENFIASILLSMRQPFRPNDLIEINGDLGKVIRLTSRATILLSLDGNHIRIPNATVFKSRIINYSRNDERRLSYELGIAPDADMNKARQLVLEAIQQLPFILKDPSPSVWVDNLAASSITLKATAWFNQRNTSGSLAKGEAINISKNALESAGIDLPEPTYRLIVNSDQTATQPKPTASKARKPKEQAVVVGNVEAKDQSALEKIITEERSETKGDDLLNKKAPEE